LIEDQTTEGISTSTTTTTTLTPPAVCIGRYCLSTAACENFDTRIFTRIAANLSQTYAPLTTTVETITDCLNQTVFGTPQLAADTLCQNPGFGCNGIQLIPANLIPFLMGLNAKAADISCGCSLCNWPRDYISSDLGVTNCGESNARAYINGDPCGTVCGLTWPETVAMNETEAAETTTTTTSTTSTTTTTVDPTICIGPTYRPNDHFCPECTDYHSRIVATQANFLQTTSKLLVDCVKRTYQGIPQIASLGNGRTCSQQRLCFAFEVMIFEFAKTDPMLSLDSNIKCGCELCKWPRDWLSYGTGRGCLNAANIVGGKWCGERCNGTFPVGYTGDTSTWVGLAMDSVSTGNDSNSSNATRLLQSVGGDEKANAFIPGSVLGHVFSDTATEILSRSSSSSTSSGAPVAASSRSPSVIARKAGSNLGTEMDDKKAQAMKPAQPADAAHDHTQERATTGSGFFSRIAAALVRKAALVLSSTAPGVLNALHGATPSQTLITSVPSSFGAASPWQGIVAPMAASDDALKNEMSDSSSSSGGSHSRISPEPDQDGFHDIDGVPGTLGAARLPRPSEKDTSTPPDGFLLDSRSGLFAADVDEERHVVAPAMCHLVAHEIGGAAAGISYTTSASADNEDATDDERAGTPWSSKKKASRPAAAWEDERADLTWGEIGLRQEKLKGFRSVFTRRVHVEVKPKIGEVLLVDYNGQWSQSPAASSAFAASSLTAAGRRKTESSSQDGDADQSWSYRYIFGDAALNPFRYGTNEPREMNVRAEGGAGAGAEEEDQFTLESEQNAGDEDWWEETKVRGGDITDNEVAQCMSGLWTPDNPRHVFSLFKLLQRVRQVRRRKTKVIPELLAAGPAAVAGFGDLEARKDNADARAVPARTAAGGGGGNARKIEAQTAPGPAATPTPPSGRSSPPEPGEEVRTKAISASPAAESRTAEAAKAPGAKKFGVSAFQNWRDRGR